MLIDFNLWAFLHRRSALRIFATLSVCLLLVSATLAAEPKLISIDDLYRLDSPLTPLVLPDAGGVVYMRRWSDRASRSVRFSLWRIDQDAARKQPLEEGEPDGRSPLLSPDGKWIVFQSTRPLPDGTSVAPVPPYSDPATDLWLISTAGAKAIPLAGPKKRYGRVFSDPFYGNVSFSADGKRLAFVADDGRDVRTPNEIRNNVRVVREDQGEGYEGYRPAQVWIADLQTPPTAVAASRIIRVTDDEHWYGDPQWTPDGKSLIVHANRSAQRESVRYSINQNYDLWRIDLADNSLHQLTTGPGPEISPRISADGRKLLYLSIPRRGSHMDVFNLTVNDLVSTGAVPHVVFDQHSPEGEKPPHLPPAFPLPRDCWLSGDKVYFNVADKTVNRTESLNLREGPAALAERLPDAHSAEFTKQADARRKLLPPADPFLKERVVAQGEVVTWKSRDGLEIEGILTRPTLPGSKPPFKTVVHPHGGPHGRSAIGFDMTVQVLAAKGYAVFQPNFRGSAGYGQKFINGDRFDLGGRDMEDILTGIEHLVQTGVVDARRQFIYGSSYGGFTTCSLIGQTNQFRAAIPQNAVTDLHVMWGLTDIQSWTEWEFGGRPWEVSQALRDHSPLTFASRVKTPTLILHAANDRRCPLPMGIMYYRALKQSGVETEMVIYPDEGHPIKQLPHMEDVLQRVLDWFAKHDLAQP
ncbi:MAG: hypothetical protein JWN70_2301 [Planctomycetaceae bacterium]|nr:hypothetical protein [Planctomycetaceae bacterium]